MKHGTRPPAVKPTDPVQHYYAVSLCFTASGVAKVWLTTAHENMSQLRVEYLLEMEEPWTGNRFAAQMLQAAAAAAGHHIHPGHVPSPLTYELELPLDW